MCRFSGYCFHLFFWSGVSKEGHFSGAGCQNISKYVKIFSQRNNDNLAMDYSHINLFYKQLLDLSYLSSGNVSVPWNCLTWNVSLNMNMIIVAIFFRSMSKEESLLRSGCYSALMLCFGPNFYIIIYIYILAEYF